MDSKEQVWKDVPGYEGLYQVNNKGQVKSMPRTVPCKRFGQKRLKGKMLSLILDDDRYLYIHLYKNNTQRKISCHLLVAMAFLGHLKPSRKMVVDHIDFNRQNNHVSNLRIVTQRENTNKKHLKSASIHTGVHWHKIMQKWQATIFFEGKNRHIGTYKCETAAAVAYLSTLKKVNLGNYACST